MRYFYNANKNKKADQLSRNFGIDGSGIEIERKAGITITDKDRAIRIKNKKIAETFYSFFFLVFPE